MSNGGTYSIYVDPNPTIQPFNKIDNIEQKIITGKMEISKADFPCLQRIENINTVC